MSEGADEGAVGTARDATPRILVAGVGNIFCSDDGFGVAVAEHLAGTALPEGVEVRDFGIRGVHLTYQLLDGYAMLVLVDAVQRGQEPGTVYVIEHDQDATAADDGQGAAPMMDAHDLSPDAILALLPRIGGSVDRVVVVGCEPAETGPGMELSAEVRRSVQTAAKTVTDIVTDAVLALPTGGGRS